MKESFEILALKMAKVVMDGPRKGWLKDARELAEALTKECCPVVIPAQLSLHIPKPEKVDKITVHIRWMIRRDMPEVLEIENHSFSEPCDEDWFIRHLRERCCIGQIAEFEERVIAFMIYELRKDNLAMKTLAVHRDFRWKGVGRQMIDKLKGKLSPQRRKSIVTRVSETNLAALMFLKAIGFRATGVAEEEIAMRFQVDPLTFAT